MKFRFFTIWLVLICISVFILQFAIPSLTDALVLNQQALKGEIWRFITAIFLHGSLQHLVFNMFALVLFGLILEKLISSYKFLIVFFTAGIFANIISAFFYPISLGASGAVYGILGALTIIRPKMVIWAFSMPMPMFVAAILWVIAGIFGLFVPSDIGHIAHLSGIFIGFILGIFFKKTQKEQEYSYKIELPERQIRSWEDKYLKNQDF